jgi:hypothetical protein
MRIQSNIIYLSSGHKVGTIAESNGGFLAILCLPLHGYPSRCGSGATVAEAIADARNSLTKDIAAQSTLLSQIIDEAEKYQPGQTRREINETAAALSEALANVETLKARLVRLGVGTDRAERLEDTVRKTKQMVSNLS